MTVRRSITLSLTGDQADYPLEERGAAARVACRERVRLDGRRTTVYKHGMTHDPRNDPDQPHRPPWPAHHIYFVTVEWLDAPHQPESPERLAHAIRHLIEHAHQHGADSPPARFVVRVKAGDIASEVTGTVTPHHHHHP